MTKPALRKRRAQRLIVGHQRTGDAVANRAGLAGDAAALDVRFDIELAVELYRAERLLHDHAAGLAAEEFVQRAAVDRYLAGALAQINPRARGLAAAGAVEGIGGCV